MKPSVQPYLSCLFALVLCPLLLFFCKKPAGPSCTIAEISEFFVNPSAGNFTGLCSHAPLPDSAFAQAIRAGHSQSVAGAMLGEWLTDSSGLPYRVGFSTPGRIRADTTYPLIIYLHGGTGSPRNDKGDSAFLMLRGLADTFQLFLASPSANRDAPWWSPLGLSRILQTLRFMALRYPVNPDKVFLAGVSDGATGCYAAANTIPDPFAGFIAVSGFGGMLPQVGMQLLPGNLMRRPIYNVNAGLDRIYPIIMVKSFVADLQSQGVPVTAKWYDKELHGFDYRAKEMGTLATLIRTWLKPALTGFSWTFSPGFPNLPDNILGWQYTSTSAGASGFWRNDTLILRTQGLSSLTLSFLDVDPAKKTNCLLMVDSEKERKIKLSPKTIGWPEQLQLLVRSCFPVFKKRTLFNVKP